MSIRNNLHTEKGLAIYAQGMCNSSSDKARINQHLVPGTILEIGCGNGAYLQTLSDDRLAQTTAIDMNAHLLQMAADNLGPRSKNVTFCRADVLRNDFPGGSFDNIVMCSVLHELYSELRTKYLNQGEATAESCARFDLQAMLYRVYKALAPKGALIIRDGVQPPNDNAVLKFKNQHVRNLFSRFVDDHPWFIQYQEVDSQVTLSKSDLFEFLSKYFYEENWNVEVLERFGWANYDDIVNLLTQAVGPVLQTVACESYRIPWLVDKWSKDFTVLEQTVGENGMPAQQPYWPYSTAIYVFQKLS